MTTEAVIVHVRWLIERDKPRRRQRLPTERELARRIAASRP
jgi:DNA-binding FadR family transcriptional regulator